MKVKTQEIFSKNLGVVKERIERIVNSSVGVDLSSVKMKDNGEFEHYEIQPKLEEKKSLFDRMEEDVIPGFSMVVINNFEIEWAKAFGVKNSETKEPVTIDTMFQAASISKSLVATVVLHLVEKGLLGLDEPVNNKLKGWKIPDNEFTKEKKITIKHILTHNSGINGPNGGFGREENSAPTILQTLNGDAPAKNKPLEVEFPPESKFQYSNFGFILLEKLVHDITGKKLNELAYEIIFEPLGMKSSLFDYPSEEIQKQMTYTHGNGEIYEPNVGLSPCVFGCGGLVTKPLDLAKFALGLINSYQGRKGSILTQTIAQKMLTKQIELNPTKFFGRDGMGFGIFLITDKDTFFFDHLGGNNPGSASIMIANPISGQGVVIMANSLSAHNRLISSILYTLAEEYDWTIYKKKT
jgi:CubicO group peptidase (beta-lactamase class C family)